MDDGRWIGNPFGLRARTVRATIGDARINGELQNHRDLYPCPVGGCVTPELHRDYLWDQRQRAAVVRDHAPSMDWASARVCPFYFRHVDSTLSIAHRNPQRFVQCYVMLPEYRAALAADRMVVAAPVFRSRLAAEVSTPSYWYPFYSGFSFVQLPTLAPRGYGPDGLSPFRWQLTAVARQETSIASGRLPIQDLFEGIDKGHLLTAWEADSRLVSISEGQATSFLLQWVLLQRMQAILSSAREGVAVAVNLTERITWCFADQHSSFAGKLRELNALGYLPSDLDPHFIQATDGSLWRSATLDDDLRLLGLVDSSGRPTSRVRFCTAWLQAWTTTRDDALTLGAELRECLGHASEAIRNVRRGRSNSQTLAELCLLLLRAALGNELHPQRHPASVQALRSIHLGNVGAARRGIQRYIHERFTRICRLVPEMHILVRARWHTPLRWLFIPLAQENALACGGAPASDHPESAPATYSALILMLEDDLHSLPYAAPGALRHEDDRVLRRMWRLLPRIAPIVSIEEQLVREYLVVPRLWQDLRRNFAQPVNHLASDLAAKVRTSAATDPVGASALAAECLTLIQALFPPGGSAGIRTSAPLVIDLAAAVGAAVQTYRLSRSHCHVTIHDHEGGNTRAFLRPLEGTYAGEDMSGRASRAAQLLILAVILERETKLASGLSIGLNSRKSAVVLEVSVPERLQGGVPHLPWHSEKRSLDEWPVGRGFYSTLYTARLIGSVWQEIAWDGERTVIRIAFQGAGDETGSHR
ncbi:MAG: hypothetical protein KJZ69_12910 [Phycisphaerales bacterium]|nr:hypothetical protein [Phycisphaerales bacterium]